MIEEIVDGPPTLGSALGTVFRAYARRFDKPRWGDKRPSYITNLHVVRRLFPDSQIVHLVRDGRDCVASLKGMSWFRGGTEEAAAMWAGAIDHGKRAARRLGPGSLLEVSYERLVTDPEKELSALCHFLQEDYHPAMVTPAEQAALVVPKRKKHHALVRQDVTGARIGAWRERLEPWEVALSERVLGARLRARGYEVQGAPPPPPWARLRYERLALRHRFAVPKVAVSGAYERLRGTRAVADLG